MKVISQTAEIFHQTSSDKDVIDKHIERCARICYKSENLIKEGSATKFVERMVKSKHYAMLEHASIYLKIVIGSPVIDSDEEKIYLKNFFSTNFYSRVHKIKYKTLESADKDDDAKDFIRTYKCPCNVYYITTNYRVIQESNLEAIIQPYLCDCTDYHVRRITAHFVTDRGVWNECIRHRRLERMDDAVVDIIVDNSVEMNFSFAQESSRYCNYSKDKFNHELTFIYPDWANEEVVNFYNTKWYHNLWKKVSNCFTKKSRAEKVWVDNMRQTEKDYFSLIETGCRAEQARTVLNNSLKTELIMTGFDDETGWKHFFNLRFKGTTGAPQAEMKTLTAMLYREFDKNGYIQEGQLPTN